MLLQWREIGQQDNMLGGLEMEQLNQRITNLGWIYVSLKKLANQNAKIEVLGKLN